MLGKCFLYPPTLLIQTHQQPNNGEHNSNNKDKLYDEEYNLLTVTFNHVDVGQLIRHLLVRHEQHVELAFGLQLENVPKYVVWSEDKCHQHQARNTNVQAYG